MGQRMQPSKYFLSSQASTSSITPSIAEAVRRLRRDLNIFAGTEKRWVSSMSWLSTRTDSTISRICQLLSMLLRKIRRLISSSVRDSSSRRAPMWHFFVGSRFSAVNFSPSLSAECGWRMHITDTEWCDSKRWRKSTWRWTGWSTVRSSSMRCETQSADSRKCRSMWPIPTIPSRRDNTSEVPGGSSRRCFGRSFLIRELCTRKYIKEPKKHPNFWSFFSSEGFLLFRISWFCMF